MSTVACPKVLEYLYSTPFVSAWLYNLLLSCSPACGPVDFPALNDSGSCHFKVYGQQIKHQSTCEALHQKIPCILKIQYTPFTFVYHAPTTLGHLSVLRLWHRQQKSNSAQECYTCKNKQRCGFASCCTKQQTCWSQHTTEPIHLNCVHERQLSVQWWRWMQHTFVVGRKTCTNGLHFLVGNYDVKLTSPVLLYDICTHASNSS